MRPKSTALQLLLAIALMMSLSPLAVLAAVTSAVDETGVLTIRSDAGDRIAVACSDGAVKINGRDPDTGPAACASITAIVVSGGPGENQFNLKAVNEALFPNVTSVRVNGGDGADTITASGFSDVLMGGPGDDLLVGVQPDDAVDPGPGQDFFGQATEPTGPPLSVQVDGTRAAPHV